MISFKQMNGVDVNDGSRKFLKVDGTFGDIPLQASDISTVDGTVTYDPILGLAYVGDGTTASVFVSDIPVIEPANPSVGDVYYDGTNLQMFDGTAWQQLPAAMDTVAPGTPAQGDIYSDNGTVIIYDGNLNEVPVVDTPDSGAIEESAIDTTDGAVTYDPNTGTVYIGNGTTADVVATGVPATQPGNPEAGDMYYDGTDVMVYDGTVWQTLGGTLPTTEPGTPAQGDTYVTNEIVYVYNGTEWVASGQPDQGDAFIPSNPIPTGLDDSSVAYDIPTGSTPTSDTVGVVGQLIDDSNDCNIMTNKTTADCPLFTKRQDGGGGASIAIEDGGIIYVARGTFIYRVNSNGTEDSFDTGYTVNGMVKYSGYIYFTSNSFIKKLDLSNGNISSVSGISGTDNGSHEICLWGDVLYWYEYHSNDDVYNIVSHDISSDTAVKVYSSSTAPSNIKASNNMVLFSHGATLRAYDKNAVEKYSVSHSSTIENIIASYPSTHYAYMSDSTDTYSIHSTNGSFTQVVNTPISDKKAYHNNGYIYSLSSSNLIRTYVGGSTGYCNNFNGNLSSNISSFIADGYMISAITTADEIWEMYSIQYDYNWDTITCPVDGDIHIEAAAPTVTNDSSEGYTIGDSWLDKTNESAIKVYRIMDTTNGSAVWKNVTSLSDVTYTVQSGTNPGEVYVLTYNVDLDAREWILSTLV